MLWSQHNYKHFERGRIRPGPGAWIPDRPAVLGLIALTYMSAGYDHKMPSKYSMTVKTLLDLLLAGQDERGCFAADDRDHAIVTCAVAEAHAMSNDRRLFDPARQGVEWLLRDGDTSAEARWSANTDLAAWDVMAMTSAKAGGVSHSIERSQKWMVGNHDVGKRCYEDGHVINATPADALAQKALLLAFLGDSTALESISAVDLIPQPGLSDVTNYWLALALFFHGRSHFQVQVDPYKGYIFGDQQWDVTMPDLG